MVTGNNDVHNSVIFHKVAHSSILCFHIAGSVEAGWHNGMWPSLSADMGGMVLQISKYFHSRFFWMTYATLPKLNVMVKRLPNESVYAYLWVSVHKIFHLCMNVITHPYTLHEHLKYPKHSPTKLFGSLLTISYGCVHIGKAFRKTLFLTSWNEKKSQVKKHSNTYLHLCLVIHTWMA